MFLCFDINAIKTHSEVLGLLVIALGYEPSTACNTRTINKVSFCLIYNITPVVKDRMSVR